MTNQSNRQHLDWKMAAPATVRTPGAASGRRLTALAGLALCTALLALPKPAAAWGQTGHRVVARIAEHHIAPETAAAIDDLIGPDSLVRVATWADEIKSDPSWKHASPWHYIDFPPGTSLDDAERSPQGDLLEALNRFSAVLRDPDAARSDRVTALKFLVHLVGDAHQPLHSGYAADRGGNDVLVLWFGDPTNLHSVWDAKLIDHEQLSFSEMAELLDHPTAEQVADWQASDFRQWITESRGLLDQVYDLGDRRLSWGYAYHATPIVEHRLLQAGVRLAGLLDRLLGPSSKNTPNPPND